MFVGSCGGNTPNVSKKLSVVGTQQVPKVKLPRLLKSFIKRVHMIGRHLNSWVPENLSVLETHFI